MCPLRGSGSSVSPHGRPQRVRAVACPPIWLRVSQSPPTCRGAPTPRPCPPSSPLCALQRPCIPPQWVAVSPRPPRSAQGIPVPLSLPALTPPLSPRCAVPTQQPTGMAPSCPAAPRPPAHPAPCLQQQQDPGGAGHELRYGVTSPHRAPPCSPGHGEPPEPRTFCLQPCRASREESVGTGMSPGVGSWCGCVPRADPRFHRGPALCSQQRQAGYRQ